MNLIRPIGIGLAGVVLCGGMVLHLSAQNKQKTNSVQFRKAEEAAIIHKWSYPGMNTTSASDNHIYYYRQILTIDSFDDVFRYFASRTKWLTPERATALIKQGKDRQFESVHESGHVIGSPRPESQDASFFCEDGRFTVTITIFHADGNRQTHVVTHIVSYGSPQRSF